MLLEKKNKFHFDSQPDQPKSFLTFRRFDFWFGQK